MEEIVAAAKFAAIAFAQRRSGQAVGEVSSARIQQENERQETLQRFGIDIGLVGCRPSIADTAPISDCEMTVPMLHRDTYSPIRESRLSLRQNRRVASQL